jgi:hypothetical protein
VKVADLPVTISGLAEKGALAVVSSFATEAFNLARTGIARLFARLGAGEEARAEAQLDGDQELVLGSADGERDDARQALASAWRLRLALLLRDCPEAREALVDLVTALHEAQPDGRQSKVQSVIVHDQATAYAAQDGNVYHYEGTAFHEGLDTDPADA